MYARMHDIMQQDSYLFVYARMHDIIQTDRQHDRLPDWSLTGCLSGRQLYAQLQAAQAGQKNAATDSPRTAGTAFSMGNLTVRQYLSLPGIALRCPARHCYARHYHALPCRAVPCAALTGIVMPGIGH